MIILRNKKFSQEEEIAKIEANPASEEYSHERAEIEKTPSREAAAIQEGYEKAEQEIDKTTEEKEIIPEAAEGAIETETREVGDANLDSRNNNLDTLNDFLSHIH
jgi:hypothetical protein